MNGKLLRMHDGRINFMNETWKVVGSKGRRGVGEMLIAALGNLTCMCADDLGRVVDKPMAGIKGEGILTSSERIEIVAKGLKGVGGVHRCMMGRVRHFCKRNRPREFYQLPRQKGMIAELASNARAATAVEAANESLLIVSARLIDGGRQRQV